MNCVFCGIVAGTEPAEIIREWPDAMAFTPINPVTDGHVLVIPRTHVRDAVEDLTVTSMTMRAAAELATSYPAANILTRLRLADTVRTDN